MGGWRIDLTEQWEAIKETMVDSSLSFRHKEGQSQLYSKTFGHPTKVSRRPGDQWNSSKSVKDASNSNTVQIRPSHERMLEVSPPMSSSNSASGYGVRTDFSGPEPGVPQSAAQCDVDQQRLYEAVPLVGRVIGVKNR